MLKTSLFNIHLTAAFAIVGFEKTQNGIGSFEHFRTETNRKPPAHNFCLRCCTSFGNIRHYVGLIKHCCDEESRSAVALRSKHQQSKGFSGGCRASAVLHSKRLTRSPSDRSVFKHQSLQDTEGLLLLVRVHDGHLLLAFSCSCDISAGGKIRTTATMYNRKRNSTKLSTCQLIPHAINTEIRTERICRFMSVMVHFLLKFSL